MAPCPGNQAFWGSWRPVRQECPRGPLPQIDLTFPSCVGVTQERDGKEAASQAACVSSKETEVEPDWRFLSWTVYLPRRQGWKTGSETTKERALCRAVWQLKNQSSVLGSWRGKIRPLRRWKNLHAKEEGERVPELHWTRSNMLWICWVKTNGQNSPGKSKLYAIFLWVQTPNKQEEEKEGEVFNGKDSQ